MNLGIIGLGGWGRRIVEAVQGTSDKVRFHTAVVARPERSSAFAEDHGMAITSDYAAVLGNAAIQGIISCGPAPLHATHTIAALRAGKPVLAIKPMGQTANDAKALEVAANETGLLLALGYDRCFYPNVAEMRKRLKSGVLGRLLHAEGNFCVDRYRSIKDGSWKADPALVTAGSLADHMLYLMIETLGHVTEVHAMALDDVSPNKLADTTAVMLRTRNNTTGLLTAIGVTPDYYHFQVFGTKGWLQIVDSSSLTIQLGDPPREELSLPGGNHLLAEVEAFADAVAGKSAFPVPVKYALHGVAVLDAMNRSVNEGKPIHVD